MNDVRARKPTSDLAEYKVPGAFMALPLRVMRLKRCNGKSLTITAKVVFAKLAWNYRRNLEFPNASQALAADFGVSRNAILRAIACLVAAHLIQRIARRRPNGTHHVNGYALIPADLVADDADLPGLTAEVRSRRDEWDAACAAIVAETAASGSDEFYGRDEWPSADDAPDEEPYDVPERNIGAMCQNGTTESMSQIGAARCAETALFDAPERDTANGTTHRLREILPQRLGVRLADDTDIESPEKAENENLRARISTLSCGHRLPWRDAEGATKCMACEPPAEVHLVPKTREGVRSFIRSVTSDTETLDAAKGKGVRALDDAAVAVLRFRKEAEDE